MVANVSPGCSLRIYQQCDSCNQVFKKWINHKQYDRVTGAVDFRDKRPSEEGMPVEGVDFDKIFALLPLKMLIFLQFIPAKQAFQSST